MNSMTSKNLLSYFFSVPNSFEYSFGISGIRQLKLLK